MSVSSRICVEEIYNYGNGNIGEWNVGEWNRGRIGTWVNGTVVE